MTDERMWTLEQVAPILGWAYLEWKAAEASKNDYKDIFFDLADAALQKNRLLALKYVTMPANDAETATERVQRHHPAWTIESMRTTKEGVYDFVMIENPSLKPYSFEHEGVKYARTVSRGPVMIDDEWLKEENPELYQQVTFALPWGERIVIPLEQLNTALLGHLDAYIYTGKPRVSLAAPRELKEKHDE